MQTGINYALDNIQRNQIAGWAAGSAADALPWAERVAFLAGVRIVEELSFEQQLAARHLLAGGANAGDARQLPAAVVAELRKRNAMLDDALALVERGAARLSLPPYED